MTVTPNNKSHLSQSRSSHTGKESEFLIDNLLVRIHFIIEMIWWTGLAPWKFEFPLSGSLTSTVLNTGKLRLSECLPVDRRACRGHVLRRFMRATRKLTHWVCGTEPPILERKGARRCINKGHPAHKRSSRTITVIPHTLRRTSTLGAPTYRQVCLSQACSATARSGLLPAKVFLHDPSLFFSLSLSSFSLSLYLGGCGWTARSGHLPAKVCLAVSERESVRGTVGGRGGQRDRPWPANTPIGGCKRAPFGDSLCVLGGSSCDYDSGIFLLFTHIQCLQQCYAILESTLNLV